MPRQKASKKLVLGVTGGFGSGKTTASRCFRDYGAQVIDADLLAHRCILPGTKLYVRLLRVFGRGILKPDKSVDRMRLARAVFDNRALLLKLNRIIHPAVVKEIRQLIRDTKRSIVVIDAPLLLEAGLGKEVDFIVVVKAGLRNQIERVIKKTGLGKAEILKRIKSQLPMAKKIRAADFVIDNNGTKRETREQVKEIISKLNWPLA